MLRPGRAVRVLAARPRSSWLCCRRAGGHVRRRGSAADYFGMHRWDDAGRLGRVHAPDTASGSGSSAARASLVEDLVEVQPPGGRRVDVPQRPTRRRGRGAGRWSRSGRCARHDAERARAAEPRGLDRLRARVRGRAPSGPGRRRDHLGHLERPGDRGAGAAGRGRQGRRRARLRDRVRLGLARRTGARAGRRRRHAGAARDRARDAGASTASSSRWSRRAPRTCRCPDASFDLAVSEYGASIWCRPVPLDPRGGAAAAARRRARLPRQRHAPRCSASRTQDDPPRPSSSGGRTSACAASSGRTTTGVDFHLGYGDWIRLLRANGFEVERPDRAPQRRRAPAGTLRRAADAGVGAAWPAEEIWRRARRVSAPPAPPLLLASTSPQRRAILEQLGIPFVVVRAALRGGATATRSRTRSARRGRCSRAAGDRPVLGVRHEVVCEGRVYGKPASRGGRRGDARAPRPARRTRSSRACA